jgi:hypothetical protein
VKLVNIFQAAGVKVLRTGLHSSEAFFDGSTLIDGPFHPAFGEIVLTRLWYQKFLSIPGFPSGNAIEIKVHPTDLNAAIGHKSLNKIMLQKYYDKVFFTTDSSLIKGKFNADIH